MKIITELFVKKPKIQDRTSVTYTGSKEIEQFFADNNNKQIKASFLGVVGSATNEFTEFWTPAIVICENGLMFLIIFGDDGLGSALIHSITVKNGIHFFTFISNISFQRRVSMFIHRLRKRLEEKSFYWRPIP